MSTHTDETIASAVVLACLLIALFATLFASPLLFLLMPMGGACAPSPAPDVFGLRFTLHHPERGSGNYCFCAPSLKGIVGGVVCNQEIARVVYLHCRRGKPRKHSGNP